MKFPVQRKLYIFFFFIYIYFYGYLLCRSVLNAINEPLISANCICTRSSYRFRPRSACSPNTRPLSLSVDLLLCFCTDDPQNNRISSISRGGKLILYLSVREKKTSRDGKAQGVPIMSTTVHILYDLYVFGLRSWQNVLTVATRQCLNILFPAATYTLVSRPLNMAVPLNYPDVAKSAFESFKDEFHARSSSTSALFVKRFANIKKKIKIFLTNRHG